MKSRNYDYIIVGAGSAGCLLANRLSADPDVRVLLLEAGGSDRHFWVRLPVGYFRTIYDARFSRVFDTEPCEGTAGRNVLWPRGRLLGGSSSINGLLYIRGQHGDYDEWAEKGATGWNYRSVLPYFKRSERYEGGANEYHGASGELGVSDLRNNDPCCRAWVAAARELGLPYNPDFNGAQDQGIGSYQLTIRKGWRCSASAAFLRPVLRRPNLEIRTGAHVSRVLIGHGAAQGIEWVEADGRHTAHAERTVILSAGAIQSPQILQLSGIGPADLLKALGIPVVADIPEVGENLKDHYQARTIVRLKRPVSLNNRIRNPLHVMWMGAQWLFNNSGPLTVGAGQVGGLARSEHAVDSRADVLFNVMPVSVDKPGDPLHTFSGFTASATQCRPLSKGSVRITSTDPFAAPRIETNYLRESLDRKVIVAGLKMLREIYAQPAFRGLVADEFLPGASATDDKGLLDFARQKGGTVFHAAGTCRMGSDASSVVDPMLNVRGIERLKVIDASVMPEMVSTNTNAAAIMIGEKGADIVLNDSRESRAGRLHADAYAKTNADVNASASI
jgi:choline dehydrogenase